MVEASLVVTITGEDKATGLYLQQTPTKRSAVVESTIPGSAAAEIVRSGDLVVAINQTDTSTLSFQQTLKELRKATRPISVRLARPAVVDLSTSTVEVRLPSGPLGIFFTEGEASCSACVMEVSAQSQVQDTIR